MEEGLGEYASPESILIAAAMMLEHIGCQEKGRALRTAMIQVKEKGIVANGTREGCTAAAFGDALLEVLNA